MYFKRFSFNLDKQSSLHSFSLEQVESHDELTNLPYDKMENFSDTLLNSHNSVSRLNNISETSSYIYTGTDIEEYRRFLNLSEYDLVPFMVVELYNYEYFDPSIRFFHCKDNNFIFRTFLSRLKDKNAESVMFLAFLRVN